MKVKIQQEGKHESEQLIAILELGLLTALEEKVMEIEDVEHLLFNPSTLNKLIDNSFDKEIVDVIHLGTELEDVQSLIPDKLDDNIFELKTKTIDILKMYKDKNVKSNRLIQEISR
ncbi:DUF3969 family protein [Sedimentibacter sp. zth1]|uniref:DUF3969 family protein n=1 Tax=Sedimentibacter sp. zth1 TaxID=2816908 RepID=UPI001A919FC4|nr:DUF3969 family protein [Sedimentibacter sp. zth1]QSX06721.1 DUF3969 family protein [Sedimentibacter sp. zth1]